jgi:hypothetical protein
VKSNIIKGIKEKIYEKIGVSDSSVVDLCKKFFDIYEEEVHNKIMSDPDVKEVIENYSHSIRLRPHRCYFRGWCKSKHETNRYAAADFLLDPVEGRELLDPEECFTEVSFINTANFEKLRRNYRQAYKKLNPVAKEIILKLEIRGSIQWILKNYLEDTDITLDDLEDFSKITYEIYKGR